MMKPEPAEIALCGVRDCPPWPYWLKKSRNGAGRSSALSGAGLDRFGGDGDDGGAHALDQIGEAERRAVLEHARRSRARIGFGGGDHARRGSVEFTGLHAGREGEGAEAHQHDRGSRPQGDGAAVALERIGCSASGIAALLDLRRRARIGPVQLPALPYSILSKLLKFCNVIATAAIRRGCERGRWLQAPRRCGDFRARITTQMAIPAPRINTAKGVSHKA